jgi:hypothetical protein
MEIGGDEGTDSTNNKNSKNKKAVITKEALINSMESLLNQLTSSHNLQQVCDSSLKVDGKVVGKMNKASTQNFINKSVALSVRSVTDIKQLLKLQKALSADDDGVEGFEEVLADELVVPVKGGTSTAASYAKVRRYCCSPPTLSISSSNAFHSCVFSCSVFLSD